MPMTYLTLYCFFFNVTASTEFSTYLHILSLHDALPISSIARPPRNARLASDNPVTQAPTPASGAATTIASGSSAISWPRPRPVRVPGRSEEHTSELQSLMRISYAVFCSKKKKQEHKDKSIHDTSQPKHIAVTHST